MITVGVALTDEDRLNVSRDGFSFRLYFHLLQFLFVLQYSLCFNVNTQLISQAFDFVWFFY
jgi:hypothetical protein